MQSESLVSVAQRVPTGTWAHVAKGCNMGPGMMSVGQVGPPRNLLSLHGSQSSSPTEFRHICFGEMDELTVLYLVYFVLSFAWTPGRLAHTTLEMANGFMIKLQKLQPFPRASAELEALMLTCDMMFTSSLSMLAHLRNTTRPQNLHGGCCVLQK